MLGVPERLLAWLAAAGNSGNSAAVAAKWSGSLAGRSMARLADECAAAAAGKGLGSAGGGLPTAAGDPPLHSPAECRDWPAPPKGALLSPRDPLHPLRFRGLTDSTTEPRPRKGGCSGGCATRSTLAPCMPTVRCVVPRRKGPTTDWKNRLLVGDRCVAEAPGRRLLEGRPVPQHPHRLASRAGLVGRLLLGRRE